MIERGQQPAFPTNTESEYYGITIREYFASHAPTAPEWFNPNVPPCPDMLITIYQYINANRLSDYANRHYDWKNNSWEDPKNEVPQKVKDNIDEARISYDARMIEIEKWKQMFEVQKFIQWKYYYADQMILAGQSGE